MFDRIITLTKQLYPTGRAFKLPDKSFFEALHKGLAVSEAQLLSDIYSLKDSLIPDNDNFTLSDAAFWERTLGLITNSNVSLANRKLAILRKMKHPGRNPAKQHYLHLQNQLREAGFDVYVYENRFPDPVLKYVTKTPEEVAGPGVLSNVEHDTFDHGEQDHGVYFNNIVANSMFEEIDFNFDIGPNLGKTFFVGGNPIGTFANVDLDRKLEFRQLILRIKPVHTVGFLFIDYV